MRKILACLPLLAVSSPVFAEHWVEAMQVEEGTVASRIYGDTDSVPSEGKGQIRTQVVFDTPTDVRQGVRAKRIMSTFAIDCGSLRGAHVESRYYSDGGKLLMKVSGNRQDRYMPPPGAVLDMCTWNGSAALSKRIARR